MNTNTVEVDKVAKKFRIFHEPPLTFQKAVYNVLRGKKNFQELWALKDISLSLHKAEAVGLIGPNASGKTTLLRIIAGIYMPTLGSVSVKGRITASLELGAGFCLEFTGMENLYFYGAVFGLSSTQIKEKIEEIREFSELYDFLDVPLRQYSFGMRMRLAFALAVHIDPDILLIDEMLAVGDIAFKKKCFEKIETLKKQGKSLLLVSHNMDEIERLCDRVILLEEGEIKAVGPAVQIIQRYKAALKG